MAKPGVYEVVVEWVEEGPFFETPFDPVPFEAWTGTVRSPAVRVEWVYPEGVDREAYEYFNGNPLHYSNKSELLERFPCSIYAAWMVHDLTTRAAIRAVRTAEDLVAGSKRPINLDRTWMGVSIPGLAPEHRYRPTTGEVFAWADRRITQLLACRDDLWFADELRFGVAYYRLRSGDHEGGKAMLREIVEKGNLPLAERAAGALRLLAAEEKGEGGEDLR